MIRFVLADLRLHALGAVAIVLLIASATALGMAVRIEERALRLGSARRFALLQVGLPMALHTKQLVRPYGDSGNALAVELVMSVFAGWSWSI